MKRIIMAIILFLVMSSLLFGQTPITLFYDSFESGAGNWTLVNGTQHNYWIVEEGTKYEDLMSMYITNDGRFNSYTTSIASVSHFYREIQFPQNATNVTLKFYFKGFGEQSRDYMTVSLVPSNIPISAGATIASTYQRGIYQGQYTWVPITIGLPDVAGQTRRLVFSWINDSSGGDQPPAAIDNLSITYLLDGPPEPAVCTSPPNGAEDIPITTSLSWQHVGGATGFKIYFGTSSNPPLKAEVGNTFSWQPNPDEVWNGTKYYWKIVPFNINSNTNMQQEATNCPTWSFRTERYASSGCSGP